MNFLQRSYRIALDAFWRFNADDGWAIASHIALSTLMAMFPFVIVIASLASYFLGSKELADEATRILLEAWPQEVAGPIANDVYRVMTGTRGDVFTFSLLFALFFASSGVESLRIGLNRAYGGAERRTWWLLRLESIGFVLLGAMALLAFSFLVVLAPLIWAQLVAFAPKLAPFSFIVTFVRFFVAAAVLVIALWIMHLWLPPGRRSFAGMAPGITATILLWLVSGEVFGRYLAEFAFAYSIMYSGLASAMIALVFLYICASIFIYGGELNAVIGKPQRHSMRKRPRRRR